jgi:hypothetical protein
MSGNGMVNGTGGSPGPNAGNAKSQGTTGNHMGATETSPGTTTGNAGTSGNASNMSIQPAAPSNSGNTTNPSSEAEK